MFVELPNYIQQVNEFMSSLFIELPNFVNDNDNNMSNIDLIIISKQKNQKPMSIYPDSKVQATPTQE